MQPAIAVTLAALALVAAATGVCAATAEAAGAADTAVARPQRIVSLDLCVDQILVDLVAPSRIAALTHLAADPNVSAVAARARALPATRGEAEVVLGLEPDLVIAGTFGATATVSLLQRVGRRVVKVALASDLDGIRATVRQIATAVGEAERGEAVVAAFDRRLILTAGNGSPARPTALIYQVNGLASGPGTLDDAVLIAAGFRNLAADLPLGSGGALPLEALVASPPDLLVLSGPVDAYRSVVADNLRHPALTAIRRTRGSIVLPWRTWLCGTPYVADAVEALHQARLGLERGGSEKAAKP